MEILGHRWIQGYGFDENREIIGPFSSYQAAEGAFRRGTNRLSNSLPDWAITGKRIIKHAEHTYYLETVILEIK